MRLGSVSTLGARTSSTSGPRSTGTWMWIGTSLPGINGLGLAGVPCKFKMSAAHHRSPSAILLMAQALTTPSLVPMRTSLLPLAWPNHIPISHGLSNLFRSSSDNLR